MSATPISSYRLELPPERKRVFVTQLKDDEDSEDEELNIRKIPVVKEKAGKLVEIGFHTLQSTLLLKRETEINEKNKEFLEKKKEFKERIERCKLKEEYLLSKQKALQNRVDKFQKFIEENNAKKERALLKCQQESKQKVKKVQEFDSLNEQLQKLLSAKEKLQAKLRKYQVFEAYLCKVIDVLPENYIEATDNMLTSLMMRYETLEAVNQQLLTKRNDLQEQLQVFSTEWQGLSLEQSQDLLICNKELAVSQGRLEELIERNAKLEVLVTKEKQNFVQNSAVQAQIILAIDNLSDKYNVRDDAKSTSLIQKLEQISNYVKERESVYEMSKPRSSDAEGRHGKNVKNARKSVSFKSA